MGEFRHQLSQAASDLLIGVDESLIFVSQLPERFDELLDTRLPILISSKAASWETLARSLWQAGCPFTLALRLVEASGKVYHLEWSGGELKPEPTSLDWALAIGWSHPEEGWRARLPLWGKSYFVTRAVEQAGPLLGRLKELGAKAYAYPTIEFCEPDDLGPWVQAVEELASFDWILFTSPNGVDYFVQRLGQAGLDLRSLAKAKFACIGPSTAKRLAEHYLKADLLPKEFVAESLLQALCQRLGDSIEGSRILLPRAQVARDLLPKALKEKGARVLVAPVYKTVAPQLSSLPPLEDNEPRLLFTSSSTVANWVKGLEAEPDDLSRFAGDWPCFCIGPITEKTAREHGLNVLGTAAAYTIDGLVDIILKKDGSDPLA